MKIEGIKCNTCRDRLLKALGRGLGRGGFPLTKLVKLAAYGAEDGEQTQSPNGSSKRLGLEASATAVAAGRGEPRDGRAPVVLSNRRGGGEDCSNKRLEAAAGSSGGGRQSDRLRIRAPVTPDLLRQIIGVVQQAAVAPPPPPSDVAGCAAAAAMSSAAAGSKKDAATSADAAAAATATELSAEGWLSTYPTPNPALLEAGEAKANGGGSGGNSSSGGGGLRGTGTGSLSFSRHTLGGGGGGGGGRSDSTERSPWALMDRVDRARDNAFKCCGVIEASTGGGGSGGGSGGLLESSGGMNGGSSSAMATGMDWNPQFAPRLQEAEAALVEWLTELTMALHGLTFQFTLAFMGQEEKEKEGDGGDLAESTALAEDLWTAYEESVKRQLELTLEARREQLREQSQPMGIALCFAAQNRLLASELLERKRAEMTTLHEATVGVMAAAKARLLLERADRARQKWSELLLPEDVYVLDDLAERVLRARLQVCVLGGGGGGGVDCCWCCRVLHRSVLFRDIIEQTHLVSSLRAPCRSSLFF